MRSILPIPDPWFPEKFGPPRNRDPEIAAFLEDIYHACSRDGRLVRDPLERVRRYSLPADIEVAGLWCSILAFGAVDLILRACDQALLPLGEHPADTLCHMDDREIESAWGQFQYRFLFPRDMVSIAKATKTALERYGSLQNLFMAGDPGGASVIPGCEAFVSKLTDYAGGNIRNGLLVHPSGGSACKRLFLFLRWMIRMDDVDTGTWSHMDPARLIIPLDTHMFATCRDRLGFFGQTGDRKPQRVPDLKAAIRATEAFRLYAPDDPVKYDFALTRPGIDPVPGDERFGCL